MEERRKGERISVCMGKAKRISVCMGKAKRISVVNRIRLTKLAVKLYNNICPTCKIKIRQKPEDAYILLCLDCLKSQKETLDKMEKLGK